MEKHIHLCIIFVFGIFICSLGFTTAEYVQCEHRLPDEMLDHVALTEQSVKGSLQFFSLLAPFLFPGLTVNLSFQGFPPSRSFDSSLHSKTILSTVIRI